MSEVPCILILNGPNMNLLGRRETQLYGNISLQKIESACQVRAKKWGMEADCRQSNHEGVLIDWIHETLDSHAGLIINAGAFTHDSIAILDALRMVAGPVIEVHLTNIHAREAFRNQSRIAAAAHGSICGFGGETYLLAIDAMAHILDLQPVALA